MRVFGILDFWGPTIAKMSACDGSFSLVKSTSRGPQIAKNPLGGPFPLINYFKGSQNREKSSCSRLLFQKLH